MEKKKIDSPMLIFIVTILGYGVACLFEMGYKSFYKLPFKLIELNPSTISYVVIVIGVVMIIALVYNSFITTDTDLKKAIIKVKNKVYLNQTSIESRKKFALFPVLGMIFLIVLHSMDIVNLNQLSSPAVIIFLMLSHLYCSFKDYYKIGLCLLCIIGILSIYGMGYSNAKNTEKYLTIKGTDLIVVDFKNDKAIVAKADFDKRVIYPEYQFIRMGYSKLNEQQFEIKYTGKMRIQN